VRGPFFNAIRLSQDPETNIQLTSNLLSSINYAFLAAAPICITIALLEYHLDRINVGFRPRLVVYVLTILVLALVFVAVWFSLQSLDQAVSGQGQSWIALLSAALVTMALFRPVRRQIGKLVYQGLFHLPA
jgi:hypothetical protein